MRLYHMSMHLMAVLGVIIGVAILLVAIPHIDSARETIAGATSTPIAAIFGVFLFLTVAGIVTGVVASLLRS